MSMIYKLADDFDDKRLLGNKGANLVTMTKLGLPVPPGFVVSIEAYREYKHIGKLPSEQIERALQTLEQETGKSMHKGLTLSVRSSWLYRKVYLNLRHLPKHTIRSFLKGNNYCTI